MEWYGMAQSAVMLMMICAFDYDWCDVDEKCDECAWHTAKVVVHTLFWVGMDADA